MPRSTLLSAASIAPVGCDRAETASSPRARSTPLPVVLAVAGMAVAIGVATATAPLATLASLVAFVLVGIACRGATQRISVAFGTLAIVPIISGLAANGQLGAHQLKLLSDVALASGFLVLPVALSALRKPIRDLAGLVLILMVSGELLACIFTHGRLTAAIPAAWQDLRWPGAIGWGLYIGRHLTATQRVRWAYRLLSAWNIAQVAAAIGQIAAGQVTGRRFSLSVVSGAFGHPTLGSIVAMMLLTLVIADHLSPAPVLGTDQRMRASILALLAVVLSTRLKPLLALAGLLVFVSCARLLRERWLSAAVAVAIPVLLFLALPFASSLTATNAEAGGGLVSSVAGHAGPRSTLLGGAENLASRAFPFGWGLGTFGSNVDEGVENSSFKAAGLGGTFGFSAAQPAFRYDSLMAHVLGERGWIGLVLWMASFVAAVVLMVSLSPCNLFPAGVMAAALALAPISPSMHDPTIALLMFLPVGLCVAPSTEVRRSKKGPYRWTNGQKWSSFVDAPEHTHADSTP
jgi:hypothetical protein